MPTRHWWLAMVFGIIGPLVSAGETPALPTVFGAGDSTMANYSEKRSPMEGWIQRLPDFAKPGVKIRNHAAGGRSTLSFRTEGRWDKLLSELKPGDFVLIQFGHNDQKKDKPEVYAAADGAYADNLVRFIEEVRGKQAHPVLVTSINRRHFDKDGKLKRTLGGYPDAMRKVAKETGTPLVDLYEATYTLFNDAGPEDSKQFFTYGQPGQFPGYPKGVQDNSHLNATGARAVAELFVRLATKEKLPVADLFATP